MSSDLVAEIIFGIVAGATGLGLLAWIMLWLKRPRAQPAPAQASNQLWYELEAECSILTYVPRQRSSPRCRFCKNAMRSYEKVCRTCGGPAHA